ncbi:4-aminobutyrate aminotransferase [Escherichia coli]|nr:4-aminobutyrate aminotransferase [Escherichia coli]GDK84328.1 4-aminobutyrate aminotransferase [Escherichia coli]
MSSNKELMQRRSQAIPRGVGQIHPIFADRAENCRVWDVGNDSNLLIVFYVQIMPDDFVMQLHRF